jgi:hypothetical protein
VTALEIIFGVLVIPFTVIIIANNFFIGKAIEQAGNIEEEINNGYENERIS